MQKGGTSLHSHSSTAGDGGALAIGTALLGTSLLSRLLSYRRPVLVYASATTVTAENNDATANTTDILFPDNDFRQDSTASHRTLDVTRVAALSGAKQSGLRTGSVAVNTWYAVYAVRATDNTTDWVLVADTVLPIQANIATLNANFGTNGWVYLGLIRNGDNGGATNAIIKFTQAGSMTIFSNNNSSAQVAQGTILSVQASSITIAFNYATGTGAAVLPNNITHALYQHSCAANPGAISRGDATPSWFYQRMTDTSANKNTAQFWRPASEGAGATTTNAVAQDISCAGFIDGVLGVGPNPLM
jgi:hypothetical protein